jgi:hypothetical protein
MLFIQNKIYKYINPLKRKALCFVKNTRLKINLLLRFTNKKNNKEINKENKYFYAGL